MNAGDTFTTVWGRYLEFLRENEILAQPGTAAFLNCGDWDLKTMLPQQLRLSGIDTSTMPSAFDVPRSRDPAMGSLPAPFDRWINIKRSYQRLYGLRNAKGMDGMLHHARMTLEGRHHSGIDDCRNILRLVQHMLADGWQPSNDIPR